MLSTGAFNALLKTLEEPPPHVKFILATTEVDKVPETIRSRALRFDFRKITEADIIARLEFVIAEEGIKAEKSAIAIIAKYARGGMRDALTLLEQNTIDSELSVEHVRMTLSLLEESQIDGIISALERYDTDTIMDTIAILRDMHVGARGFFEQVMYRLRDLMIENLDNSGYMTYQEIYELIESAYTRVRSIPDGMLLIEMTLLKVVKRGSMKEDIGDREVKSEKKELKKNDSTLPGLGGGNLSKNSSTKNLKSEEFSSGEEKSNTDEQSEGGVSFSSPNSFGTFATKSTETGL
jgi:DNA polymerase III subunit gamma/tau